MDVGNDDGEAAAAAYGVGNVVEPGVAIVGAEARVDEVADRVDPAAVDKAVSAELAVVDGGIVAMAHEDTVGDRGEGGLDNGVPVASAEDNVVVRLAENVAGRERYTLVPTLRYVADTRAECTLDAKDHAEIAGGSVVIVDVGDNFRRR